MLIGKNSFMIGFILGGESGQNRSHSTILFNLTAPPCVDVDFIRSALCYNICFNSLFYTLLSMIPIFMLQTDIARVGSSSSGI